MNNCYLSGNSNGHQQQTQYQQQKPLSISANNFSPASNSFSDNSKSLYKSSSHNINTGGNCDKNYQQQQQQQQHQQLYANSSKNGNSASYLSQSTPSTHFDFDHMLFNDPNDIQNSSGNNNLNKNQSYNTTASESSRSSRSYQTNQPVNSDQFQGSKLNY